MCDLHSRDEESAEPPVGVTELIDELVVAITNCRIYWSGHPRVLASVQALRKTLGDHLGRDHPAELVIGAADGWLFHETRPLLGASLSATRILDALTRLGSGGLEFQNWAEERDFLALVAILARAPSRAESAEAANDELEEGGCSAIRFLPPYSEAEGSQQFEGARALPIRVHQGLVEHLQDTMVRVCHGEEIDLSGTRTQIEVLLGKFAQNPSSMMRMSRYERYDAFTFGHSIRVGVLALSFASSLTTDQELLHRIGLSALMHDIGKARVPFEILHSTGRLDRDEREAMSQHAAFGSEILLQQGGADPMSVATAFGHHLTMDGRGYPRTLHAARLSFGTRIVKICDVYEALTAVRPYKDRMSPLRAYRVMLSMDGHFDQRLLRKFIFTNGLYPVGTRVRLSTGETARVVAQTRSIQHPLVELEEFAEAGDMYEHPGPRRALSPEMEVEAILS